MMIDTHCHLADPKFDLDLFEVIERAKKSGVHKAIVCAEFCTDFSKIFKLAEDYPDFIRPAIGVHPAQKENTSANWSHFDGVEACIRQNFNKLIAIGEVGLDLTQIYLKNIEEDKRIQKEILKKQIQLAKELNLPLNVHSRSAGKETIEFLIENGAIKNIQMHAFSGIAEDAKHGINAGFYFSIPPSFSIKNVEEKTLLIQKIPLTQLLLETDSPVLGPNKNERNEPQNLRISANFIAKVKQVSVEEVIAQTTKNAYKLYPRL